MNKHCEKYFGLIEKLVEGEELAGELAAQAESHILDCPECCCEYELLQREKEVLAGYMFEFEPPPNSWLHFQTRLVENEETFSGNAVDSVELPHRRKRFFVLGFSPALATAAGLLLFFGIGFVVLRNTTFEKNIAEIKPEDARQSSPQEIEADPKTSPDTEVKNVAVRGDAPKNNEPVFKNQSSKSGDDSLLGKKSLTVEAVRVKQKTVSSGFMKKPASESVQSDEARTEKLQKQNLETEIAAQFEKIELLLRSFRNARATDEDAAAGFDVEYEKRQARKLLESNAALRRDAETYGISYAEELLSRVEPYLLEIANLENNPSAGKVLDIRERVSSQNIIANLHVYSSVAMTH